MWRGRAVFATLAVGMVATISWGFKAWPQTIRWWSMHAHLLTARGVLYGLSPCVCGCV